jgi:hypothetical protein
VQGLVQALVAEILVAGRHYNKKCGISSKVNDQKRKEGGVEM